MGLDQATLALQFEKRPTPPLRALLNHKKCENSPLADKDHPYCPVARNFAGFAEQFKDTVSHENVTVVVTTEEQQYSKTTTIQQRLGALIGIIMTTSGCPITEHLKPMTKMTGMNFFLKSAAAA